MRLLETMMEVWFKHKFSFQTKVIGDVISLGEKSLKETTKVASILNVLDHIKVIICIL